MVLRLSVGLSLYASSFVSLLLHSDLTYVTYLMGSFTYATKILGVKINTTFVIQVVSVKN